MSRTLLLSPCLLLLGLCGLAHAQTSPPASASLAAPPPTFAPPPLLPPPPVIGPSWAAPPEDELYRQLRVRDERLARHETEIRELRAALKAQVGPPLPTAPPPAAATPAPDTPWYNRLQIRGYLQFRYNQIPSADSNEHLTNEQGDKSIGKNGGLGIRRARVIVMGDIHPRVSIYIQPDFASAIGDQFNVGILRDVYADLFFDRKKEFRLRIGQSKIPFGFENLQSSQNRVPLDRSDSLNSAWLNERDLAVFFYWAPAHIRARFRHFLDSGLRGSGDYGVVGVGVFNGQILNRAEQNAFPHVVARVTWPFAIGRQFLELGGGGYYGKYTVKLETPKDAPAITATSADNTLDDARGHLSAVLYPKPFGLICELNAGISPSLGVDDRTVVDSRFLYGGYVLAMLRLERVLGTPSLIPYARGTLYSGGKKFFTNAPHYEVKELELGVRWQVVSAFEFVVAYALVDRTADKYPYKQESGQLVRLHTQINY